MSKDLRKFVCMNQSTYDFILAHRHADVRQLALQSGRFPDVDMPFALQQISGWQTARHKIPTWAATDGIVYPPHLNMEQCSSEQTAMYKARLVRRLLTENSRQNIQESISNGYGKEAKNSCGNTEGCRSSGCFRSLIDLTGGLGIDFFFMSKEVDKAVYVEQSETLCATAKHNFKALGVTNATVIHGDGTEILRQSAYVSVCFVDPARRNEQGGRTYAIEDCTPDVLKLRHEMTEKAAFTILKLSPMLDWHRAVEQLETVREVHILSVKNECKELLLVLSEDCGRPLVVHCVNDDKVFSYHPMEDEAENHIQKTLYEEVTEWCLDAFDLPLTLYEPNSSIMKAGCFKAVGRKFGLQQVADNSHLFLSHKEIGDFPGRTFRISAVSTMNKKQLRQALQGIRKANVAVRNFPMTVAELRRKLNINEGGDTYIFATTTEDGRHLLFIGTKTDGG